jgi:hypothetical protein
MFWVSLTHHQHTIRQNTCFAFYARSRAAENSLICNMYVVDQGEQWKHLKFEITKTIYKLYV